MRGLFWPPGISPMPLPIISQSAESLLRLFGRSEVQWSQHLAEETQLDFGLAFANKDLSNVAAANCLLDAALPAGVSPSQAIEQSEKFFRERGTRCHRWVLNPSSDGAALVEVLQSNGYTIDRRDLLYLTNHSQSPQRGEPLTILPARSSFKHARAIAEEQGDADAELLHLDDSHTDAFIALRDGKAAAYLATLTMGEVGVIENLYVAADFRRRGIGRTMMACAIDLAARAQWRHVMMPVPQENVGLLELAGKSGFVKIADWLAYIPAITG